MQEHLAVLVQAEVDRLLGKMGEMNTKVDGLASISSETMTMFRDESDKFATRTRASLAEADQKAESLRAAGSAL